MNDLSAERVSALLTTRRFGRSLSIVSETGSTNDDAKRAARQGALDGHVIVADAQRAGHGSHGRSWSSPAGTDLYVSIICAPRVEAALLPQLTLAVGLGVALTVEEFANERASIKWPNDVWLRDKKCAGILVEGMSSGSRTSDLVIGIGLNVNRTDWPEDLANIATSLKARCAKNFDRARVLASLLQKVETQTDLFFESRGLRAALPAIRERLAWRGMLVRVDDKSGTLEGVDETGALLLRTETGLERVLSGTLTRA